MANNIEKFNYYVGYVFSILQEEFPCRVKIDFVKMCGYESCPETISSAGQHTGLYMRDGEVHDITEELDFVYETVHWLFETGYLIGNCGLSNFGRSAVVTLSPKSLEILKAIPVSINSKKSIGQELSEAMNSAAKSQVAEIGGKALSYLFQIGWGSLHNP